MSMPDPTISRSSVVIKYGSSDGFSSTQSIKNNKDTPHKALMTALDEISRLTALFGFEVEAETVFYAARSRVAEWKKSHALYPDDV